MNRKARSQLAEKTLEILEAGGYQLGDDGYVDISDALRCCLAGTRSYTPDELQHLRERVLSRATPSKKTDIEVVNQSTLAAAAELRRRLPDRPIGVLNFASAKKPGGGFLGGSQAQEESLARSSGLYPSLRRCPDYYRYHRAMTSPLYSHRAIYSPDCPVFRNDTGVLLAAPYTVAFITCPAPNAGAVRAHQPSQANDLRAVLRERVTLILGLALYHELTDLVLGAWGCGVFGNDPRDVAAAFRDALGKGAPFEGRFRSIRFSVLDRSRERATYRAFAEAFEICAAP
ncbi:TIGR02452 family protein [Halomonas sp. ATCH28]|uniref:TIGR02452 family protein n=1 Tax=Halomonas gemina TaxID=2945105 RepID=A0ABT0SZN2_9GAMM|nr:TIGR02452 family protein [Halomonas gemina]MCL7939967.1 TIGR02452 family protein [Halomonas gemina]